MSEKKPVFVTLEDERMVVSKADAEVRSGQGAIPVTMADLEKLAKLAQAKYKRFQEMIPPIVTRERAERIRVLRQSHSWRALAEVCHEEFSGDWYPASNQLAGMVLCESAAAILGEDTNAPPWN